MAREVREVLGLALGQTAARSRPRSAATISRGCMRGATAHTRPQMLAAAFTEICWPTMARASVWNGSPRGSSAMRGCARMMRASTGSVRASARFARIQ